jgi:parallel beta-helix repeat protein
LKVTDVGGGPLYRGIIEDLCGDVSYFTRVHFHSSFSLGDASLLDWVQHNGYAFYIKTSDWVKLTNCFAYGYLGGLVALGTNDMKVVACGMDACIHPYYLTSTSKAVISSSYGTAYHNPGGLVAEYPTDGNCFELLGTGGENIISDNEMYAAQSGVSITSTTNKNNTISDNSIHTFGIATTGNGFGVITYSTGNIISDNRINGRHNTNTFGIYLNDASRNVVTGNSISDVSTAGISLTATIPAYVVVGNMLSNTVGGISNAAGGGNSTSQVMQHNVVV